MGTAPALLLSVFGALRLRANRLAQGLFAFAVFVVASYLVYAVFDDWSYLRFLLPAMAIFAVFASIELSA
jgi:TM2 domain-containing membrane protein YozV